MRPEIVDTIQERIHIINTIRANMRMLRKYSSVTKRIAAIIRALLDEEYIVHTEIEKGYDGVGKSYVMTIWGQGITYGNCIYLNWGTKNGEAWQDGFLIALNRADLTDQIERESDEKTLEPELAKLEATVVAAKAKALALVTALPVPASAKGSGRNDKERWSTPSTALYEKFPNCFS